MDEVYRSFGGPSAPAPRKGRPIPPGQGSGSDCGTDLRRADVAGGLAERDTVGMTKARLVSFGLVELDGRTYDHDVLVERGRVSRRRRRIRSRSGPVRSHPADHRGASAVALPADDHRDGRRGSSSGYARGRRGGPPPGIELLVLRTEEACVRLSAADATADVDETAAVLHVTC